MKIKDYILTTEEVEVVEYIFDRLKLNCPNVVYIPRQTVLGIGEITRHLMVYFSYHDNMVWAKFKGCEPISLLSDSQEIDALIDSTVELFSQNAFLLREPSEPRVKPIPSNKTPASETADFELVSNAKREYQTALERVDDSVEILNYCSYRLSNCLSKCDIITVGDLKKLSVEQVLKIRYFGRKCFQELLSVLKKLGEEKGEEKEVTEGAKGNDGYLLDYCSIRLRNCLLSRGITTIDDLKDYTPEQLFKIRNFGKKCYLELIEIVKRISENQPDFDTTKTIDRIVTAFEQPVIELDFSNMQNIYDTYKEKIPEFNLFYPKLVDLIEKFSNAILKDKEKRIYYKRIGLDGDYRTLDDIGKSEGCSRERIRQIIEKAKRKFHLCKAYSLIAPRRYKTELLEELRVLSIEAFIFYLVFKSQLNFLKDFFYDVFLDCTSKCSADEILKLERALQKPASSQDFNARIFSLITFFRKERVISDEAWGRLKAQSYVTDYTKVYQGVYNFNGRDYYYESKGELSLLQKFLKNNTFKDVKTRSIAISYGENRKYCPDFQCLTHDNKFVIIDVKMVLHMCEKNNIVKFEALKNYCER